MAISASTVKELRERTGAGMMDCKQALTETDGNLDQAIEWLRKKGLASVAKRAGRAASEGAVFSYIHHSGKIGVLIELNCETDFVAKTDDFKALGHELAMQIAAMAPEFVSEEEIPAERLEREREILTELTRNEGKPEAALPKIVEGRLRKLLSDVCLLDQIWVRAEKKETIRDVVNDTAVRLGERVSVRRFVRFNVAESSDEPAEEA
jgi:elongation factor Ts